MSHDTDVEPDDEPDVEPKVLFDESVKLFESQRHDIAGLRMKK